MEEFKREKIHYTPPEELGREAFEEWRTEREIPTPETKKDRRIIQSTPSLPKDEKQIQIEEKERAKKVKIKGKIKHLLFLAEEKGLSYALKKAHQEKDAFLLDVFHDILTKNESYLRFLKK